MPDQARKITDLSENDLAKLIDDRITKALGLNPEELEAAPQAAALMSTPSVLSTVRATAAAMC